MCFGIDFWEDFGGFWGGKWSQVGTKIDQKSMRIAKTIFLNKLYFEDSGGLNRSQLDPKIRLAFEGILAWIFDRFWWILGAKLGGKTDPKSKKKL